MLLAAILAAGDVAASAQEAAHALQAGHSAVAPDMMTAQPAAASDISAGKRTVVLSLDKCVEIALGDNPTVKVADMEIKRADYSKKETLASLFPQIDFGLQYSRSIELQSLKMNFGDQSQTIKMGQDNSWGMGFSVALPVIAPQLWKSLQISDTQILASLESSRSSRLDLINQVEKAYYALLLAKASKEVLLQNYDNALFNADLYKKKFEAGTASEYDVLRSSVQVKNVEPQILQADISVRQAQLQLAILMGLDADIAVEPDTDLKNYQQDMFARQDGGYSIEENTQLRALDIQRQTLSRNVELKKLAWVPTLAATFNLNWSSLSNGNMFKHLDLNPYSNVGFALSVPIFSGGSKYYGLKQSKIQLAEAELQRENLVRSINMQLELAVDNINMEVRQIESSAEGVREAEKAHEIMQKSFEIGAATYLDLRDSELAETSARLVYYQAIYNYLVSNSELDLLLGRRVASSEMTRQKR